MGHCALCGQPVGLFKKEHRQCRARRENAWEQMLQCVRIAIPAETPSDQLLAKLSEVAHSSYLGENDVRKALVVGWEQVAAHFLEDGHLDEGEEHHLLNFLERAGLPSEEADHHGTYTTVVKGAAIRELLEGKIPQRCPTQGQLPFNFQKSESLIWVFTNTGYLEDLTKRHYVGGHHGVSVRVAKGLYYRAGAFRGHPVETTRRTHVDTGLFAVTTKHLYFAGPAKSFRIRHDKIVSYTAYSDGIGVHRDAASAKPQTFITGDGWFTYNLVVNAANL